MRTREVEAAMKAVADEFAEAVPDAFAGDGVAFLQTVYKDPKLPLSIRMDAAAKAARFERPMLASTNVRVIRRMEDLTDEELQVRSAAQATERALWPASSAKPTNGCEADQTIAFANIRTIGYYSV